MCRVVAAMARGGTVMGGAAVKAPGTATEPVVAVMALERRERGVEAVMEPETVVEELVPLSADMEAAAAMAARMAA